MVDGELVRMLLLPDRRLASGNLFAIVGVVSQYLNAVASGSSCGSRAERTRRYRVKVLTHDTPNAFYNKKRSGSQNKTESRFLFNLN